MLYKGKEEKPKKVKYRTVRRHQEFRFKSHVAIADGWHSCWTWITAFGATGRTSRSQKTDAALPEETEDGLGAYDRSGWLCEEPTEEIHARVELVRKTPRRMVLEA